MIDYKNCNEATHKPRTLTEYGCGLYFGLIDIESEFECYDVNYEPYKLDDIKAIEFLINYAEEANDYDTI